MTYFVPLFAQFDHAQKYEFNQGKQMKLSGSSQFPNPHLVMWGLGPTAAAQKAIKYHSGKVSKNKQLAKQKNGKSWLAPVTQQGAAAHGRCASTP